jgi:hypothetical protein
MGYAPSTLASGREPSTRATVHEPLYAASHFEVDIDARRARLVVPGLIEASGEPIHNPVTGAEHRARIELPLAMVSCL